MTTYPRRGVRRCSSCGVRLPLPGDPDSQARECSTCELFSAIAKALLGVER